MSIKTLSIQGYRSIQNIRLTMDDINIIVGVNNAPPQVIIPNRIYKITNARYTRATL